MKDAWILRLSQIKKFDMEAASEQTGAQLPLRLLDCLRLLKPMPLTVTLPVGGLLAAEELAGKDVRVLERSLRFCGRGVSLPTKDGSTESWTVSIPRWK